MWVIEWVFLVIENLVGEGRLSHKYTKIISEIFISILGTAKSRSRRNCTNDGEVVSSCVLCSKEVLWVGIL